MPVLQEEPGLSCDTLPGTGVTSRRLWFPSAVSHLLTETGSGEKAPTLSKHLLRGSSSKQSPAHIGGWAQPWALCHPQTTPRARLCSAWAGAEEPQCDHRVPLHCPGWAGHHWGSWAGAEGGDSPGRLFWAIQTHQGRQLLTLTVFFNFSMSAELKKISTMFSRTNHLTLFVK